MFKNILIVPKKYLPISKYQLFGYIAVESLWLVNTKVSSFPHTTQSQEKSTSWCFNHFSQGIIDVFLHILVKKCIFIIKFSTLYFRYLQS